MINIGDRKVEEKWVKKRNTKKKVDKTGKQSYNFD